MGKKEEPFWANKKPIMEPQPIKVKEQIVITLNREMNQINIQSNIKDGNLAMGMLIDAMVAMHKQRVTQEKNKIVQAIPRIIMPGA